MITYKKHLEPTLAELQGYARLVAEPEARPADPSDSFAPWDGDSEYFDEDSD